MYGWYCPKIHVLGFRWMGISWTVLSPMMFNSSQIIHIPPIPSFSFWACLFWYSQQLQKVTMPIQLHNCNILSITTKLCKGLMPKREKTEKDTKTGRREQRLTDTHFCLNKQTTLSGLKLWLFQPTSTKENYRTTTSESILTSPFPLQLQSRKYGGIKSIYGLQPKLPELISA